MSQEECGLGVAYDQENLCEDVSIHLKAVGSAVLTCSPVGFQNLQISSLTSK
jgi:hypothetical protein